MSVKLPGNLLWWTNASATRLLTSELRRFLPEDLRGPWDEAERLGIDQVDLRAMRAADLARVRDAVLHVIEDDERRGPSGYPMPATFPPYLEKLRELATLLSGAVPEVRSEVEPGIRFQVGAAHAPDSPWGEDAMTVFLDGRFEYRNQRGPWVRRATGRLSTEALDRLVAAFQALPRTADLRVAPPGSSVVRLALDLPEGTTEMILDYYEGLATPKYGPVLSWFDRCVTHLRNERSERSASPDLLDIVDEALGKGSGE